MNDVGERIKQIETRMLERTKTLKSYESQQKPVQDNSVWDNLNMEMQIDHQKVLLWEAEAVQQDKQLFRELREKIEKQQTLAHDLVTLSYTKKTKHLAPPKTIAKNVVLAFLVGGTITTIGQVILNLYTNGGLMEKEAAAATSASLIFLGALLTGIGIYDKIGSFAGAGSLVPITGFANSIVSSALEYKREGFLYGVGAKIFTISGPVILYGTVVSMVVGLIYYFVR